MASLRETLLRLKHDLEKGLISEYAVAQFLRQYPSLYDDLSIFSKYSVLSLVKLLDELENPEVNFSELFDRVDSPHLFVYILQNDFHPRLYNALVEYYYKKEFSNPVVATWIFERVRDGLETRLTGLSLDLLIMAIAAQNQQLLSQAVFDNTYLTQLVERILQGQVGCNYDVRERIKIASRLASRVSDENVLFLHDQITDLAIRYHLI